VKRHRQAGVGILHAVYPSEVGISVGPLATGNERAGPGNEAGGAILGSYANTQGRTQCIRVSPDFGQAYAETDKVRIHTRIITGPIFAKALLHTLQESLGQ
jgi:hypothetical protein